MLFAYTYVPHQMDKMQQFIDFVFFKVWCEAPIGLQFHPDLFKDNAELQEIMSFFGFSAKAPERGKTFYKDVKQIYDLFALLPPQDIDKFREWYRNNNDIENVCEDILAVQPMRYVDFPVAHCALRDRLASFFKDLYSKSLLGLAALKEKIGDIDDHYDAFVTINNEGKCPFCGIGDLFTVYHNKREAYDHYLPKALYPFNSINFKNLVPACYHCNSSYKTSKDPAYIPKDPANGVAHRRRTFYPYRTNAEKLQILVNVAHSDYSALTPGDISFEFGPKDMAEELATWCDVYGIEERYRAKLLAKNDGKYWLTQALDEWPSKGKGVAELLGELALEADKYPVAECNFLKSAYLHGCLKAGII